MNERLKQLRQNLGFSQKKMAKDLGIGQSSLGAMETGRRAILERHIRLLSTLYNVSDVWLRSGKGSMFITENVNKANGFSPKKQAIIDAVASLPDHDCDIMANVFAVITERLQIKQDGTESNKKSPATKNKA